MSIISNLNIDDIKIIENEFKLNPNFQQIENTEEIPVNVVPEFFLNEENPKVGRVKLTVELYEENFIEHNMPYYLKVVILGQFSLSDNEDDEEYDIFEQFALNMTTMLFPYVRSYIAGLTGLAGIPSVNIPAINIFKLFNKIESDQ